MNSNHGSSTAKVDLKPVVILGVATFLYWISLHAYTPLIPGYARSLGAGVTIIGIIAGAYGFVQIFLRIPTGVWADRLGRYKPFVLVGCVLASVSGLLLIAIDSPLGLVIARLLAGLAATCWLAFMILFHTYFPQSTAKAVAIIATRGNDGYSLCRRLGKICMEKDHKSQPAGRCQSRQQTRNNQPQWTIYRYQQQAADRCQDTADKNKRLVSPKPVCPDTRRYSQEYLHKTISPSNYPNNSYTSAKAPGITGNKGGICMQ